MLLRSSCIYRHLSLNSDTPSSRQSSAVFDDISLGGDPTEEIEEEEDTYVPTEVEVELELDEPDANGDLRTPRDPTRGFHSEIDAQPEEGEDVDVADIGASQERTVPVAIHVSPPTSPPPMSPPETSSTSRYSEDLPSSSLSAAATASTSAVSLPAVPSSAPVSRSDSPARRAHRPTRSAQGPSIFEQVVSKTRPSFLPPKPKKEDVKHMHDWETMMRQSRAAEEKRRKAAQDRRLAREAKVEQSLHIWEREVVPNWAKVRETPRLRSLWWAGIPTKLRSTMWERAVGNALALSRDSYRICLSRAKRAIAAGTFPTTTLSLIDEDVRSTLPSLHIFHPDNGPLYEDLKDMLCAWVVSRADEGLGYARGIARLAGMIILNMPAPQGFVMLRNLLERHCMRAFYGLPNSKDDVDAYYRIFDTLLADGMPKIYFNFKQHQISPAAYLPDWIIPLFLDHLPFEACARLWDVILLEGDSFVYRACLAMLAVLEPRLFFPDRQELLELLKGENKAAIEVARRDGVPLDGGRYEIYGVDEEALWDRITGMDEWWRDSTWQRLLQRELPDL
ncbi:RabGAP/TBC [Peniophora sp. CONT]|nr:RabGAP/TBC [Peniophora sp. CONT]